MEMTETDSTKKPSKNDIYNMLVLKNENNKMKDTSLTGCQLKKNGFDFEFTVTFHYFCVIT